MNTKYFLAQILIFCLLLSGCGIDKTSTIRSGNYKEDLETLSKKSPEIFGKYSPEEIYEGILKINVYNENLSYQDLVSIVKDTLDWLQKVDTYEIVNTQIRKYMVSFGGVIKNQNGQYDFIENILRNPNILGSPYDHGFKDLSVAIDLFSNDGAMILGCRNEPSYKYNVDQILNYEKLNKDVLYGEIVLEDLEHYQKLGLISKVIDIENLTDEKIESWYEIAKLYFEKLIKSEKFKLKREKAIKGWKYFNKQPQLFEVN